MTRRSRFLAAPLLAAFASASLAGPVLAQPDNKPAPAKPVPPPPPPKPPKDDKAKDKDKAAAEKAAYATEVTVLHATNGGKGIDPRIGNMPELKKPPFSSYNSYELLSKTKLQLSTDDKTMNLPNGRVLKTKLIKAEKEHVTIRASINQRGGTTFLPLLEVTAKVDKAFIVAGPSHKGGILVLVIRVVKA